MRRGATLSEHHAMTVNCARERGLSRVRALEAAWGLVSVRAGLLWPELNEATDTTTR